MTIATAPITLTTAVDTQPLLLNVTNTRLTVTSEQFVRVAWALLSRLCLDNPNLRLELTPNRELIVMALTGGESGKKNAGWLFWLGLSPIKQELLQELSSTPDRLIIETLNFLQFLKAKEKSHWSTGESLLAHLETIGTWQGDDFDRCLQSLKKHRWVHHLCFLKTNSQN